jgi:hypothetical protein
MLKTSVAPSTEDQPKGERQEGGGHQPPSHLSPFTPHALVPAVLQPSRRRQKEYRPLSSNLYRVLDATTAFNPLVFINVYWPR